MIRGVFWSVRREDAWVWKCEAYEAENVRLKM